jgi:hypothetical protein
MTPQEQEEQEEQSKANGRPALHKVTTRVKKPNRRDELI